METTPQLENGFIRIASGNEDNDILINLIKCNLSACEYQIVFLILRKTYGYNKKEDYISLSQFEKYICKTRVSIVNSISRLVKKNILVKKTTLGKISSYQFNKDFSTWNALVKKTIPVKKTLQTSKENFNQLVKKTLHTKDIYTKETITKDNTVPNILHTPIHTPIHTPQIPSINNKEKIINNKEGGVGGEIPTPKEPTIPERLINLFNRKTGRVYKLTDGRKKQINLRLKTFTPEEIAQAITKMLEMPFYRGENNRRWEADPDFILRNDEQIDKFLGKTKQLQVDRLSDLIK